MSAYLTSNDSINALVTYLAMRCSHHTQRNLEEILIGCFRDHLRAISNKTIQEAQVAAVEFYREKFSHLTEETCAHLLLLLQNQASLEARYPGDKDMRDSTGYGFKRSSTVLKLGTNTGLICGILQGYEYQSCEDRDWETSPAYFLCQRIRDHLVNDHAKNTDPQNVGWSSWAEPTDAPKLVLLTDLVT